MEVTLDMLLASRDERRKMQTELLQSHPKETLVCLTVVMPGRIKRNEQSLTVARAAIKALQATFGKNVALQRDLPTGYEAYMLTTVTQMEAKKMACEVEDNHPLGRLFDIDIISHAGMPISRAAVGQPPRRCLLCQQEARYCMRNHTHTQEQLLAKIDYMVDEYRQLHQSQVDGKERKDV